jgi:hypothetical protein
MWGNNKNNNNNNNNNDKDKDVLFTVLFCTVMQFVGLPKLVLFLISSWELNKCWCRLRPLKFESVRNHRHFDSITIRLSPTYADEEVPLNNRELINNSIELNSL